MFSIGSLASYLAAVVLVVISPGPDNLLALSRGITQGRLAGALSSIGAGMGIMVHTVAATLGLTIALQASPIAFWIIKVIGAAYLLWLGIRALRTHSLISSAPSARQPLIKVLTVGLMSNFLNPKVGLFVLAFIPQFVDAKRGPVPEQMLALGAIFAVVTVVTFSLLAFFAAGFSGWLNRQPKATIWLNRGAGAAFIAAGLSIMTIGQRR